MASSATNPLSTTPRGTADLLQQWLSSAESQVAALQVLTTQLPGVNDLLQGSFEEITAGFMEISSDFKQYQAHALEAASGEDEYAIKAMTDLGDRISQNIMRLVMALQFQDRVSQNLVITINVMNAIIAYQQDGIQQTQEKLEMIGERAPLDLDFTKELLNLLNLGELKQHFVEHLVQQGFIEDTTALGILPNTPQESAANNDDDDIELF